MDKNQLDILRPDMFANLSTLQHLYISSNDVRHEKTDLRVFFLCHTQRKIGGLAVGSMGITPPWFQENQENVQENVQENQGYPENPENQGNQENQEYPENQELIYPENQEY